MKIYSSAFDDNQKIPDKYTCQGKNVNPPLFFSEVPQEAKSLALIIEDPDAVSGLWVHWLLYNINPLVREVKENFISEEAIQGITSFGEAKYGGPCPPSGIHRYFFKLFALSDMILTESLLNRESFLDKIQNNVINKAVLVGLYEKSY